MSRQCFILCLDDVVIESPLSWPRRSSQEARVATRAWLKLRSFRSRQEICCVITGFHGIVSRYSNSMSRNSWSGWDFFCRDREFLGRDRVS